MFNKLIILSLLLFTFAFAQSNNPKIAVEPDEYDFGTINQGDKVSHDFEILNQGNSELRILNVRGSCGCTAAIPAKTNLQPGDSTKLTVVFNSAGKIGKQQKAVFIKTNDPSNSMYTLRFTGNVIDESSLKNTSDNVISNDPKIFFPETEHDFGTVAEGKVVDYKFKIVNKGNSTLQIQDIRTSCGCTAALLNNKSIYPGQEDTIKVQLNTKNHSGKMVRTVTIKSNDPKDPTSTLTIYADVVKG
jgi:hypothetical protein